MSTNPKSSVLKSAGFLSGATALSRILGFVRDWLIAFFYGTTPVAQAFIIAYRIPNMLRTLIGEGAANSVFVPVLSRIRALEGESAWRSLVNALWSRLWVGLGGAVLIGVLAAPFLVRAMAPGFSENPELELLTIRLTRILFPFLGLIGLYAFWMGALNSIGHFKRPAYGPPVLNLCMIAGLFLWRPDGIGLSIGVLTGGLLQLLIQWPILKQAGIKLSLNFRSAPGLKEIKQLLLPRISGAAVYQTSILVDTIFASFSHWVGAGGVAALYFANRFLQLPLGLFGVSVAQAALPTLTQQVATGDLPEARRTFELAVRSTLLIALPSAIGLSFLAHGIIETLLEHGAFSGRASSLTASALQWYALGLIPLCMAKIFVNALYSLEETWVPVRSALLALVVNIGFNFLLVGPMGLAGLALATSIAAWINAGHLYKNLHKRLGPVEGVFGSWLFRLGGAGAGMWGVILLTWNSQELFAQPHSTPLALCWLFGTILAGVAAFFGLAILLRVPEADQFFKWLLKKK